MPYRHKRPDHRGIRLPAALKLTKHNYQSSLLPQVAAEQLEAELELKKHDKEGATLEYYCDREGEEFLRMHLPGLPDGRPNVPEGNTVKVKRVGAGETDWHGLEAEWSRGTELYMSSENGVLEREVREEGGAAKFDVHFVLNTFNFDNMNDAINELCPRRLGSLFPVREWGQQHAGEPSVTRDDLEFSSEVVGDNPMQSQAVEQILAGRHAPNIYVLFGPPGTGKTMTVVEAIYQVQIILFLQSLPL